MRAVTRIVVLLVLGVVLAAAVGSTAQADSATRSEIDSEFTFPDMCSFPVVVHWQGFALANANVYRQHAIVTITNPANERSVKQFVNDTSHIRASNDGGSVVRETGAWKIVQQGSGLVWADIGQEAWFYDKDRNLIGTKLAGIHDPCTMYLDATCGLVGI